MSKKLAIIFPGIGYTYERPLLYYSKKILMKNGYEIFLVDYPNEKKDGVLESKDKLLQFVASVEDVVWKQLENIGYSAYDKIVFVSKSIGAVVGAVYAKKKGIKPYHLMITPIDFAFSFIEDERGSAFCGTEDPLVNFEGVKNICKEKQWDFYEFKRGNHSLETGDIERDVNYLQRFVSITAQTVEDLDKSIYDFEIECRNQNTKSMEVRHQEQKKKSILFVLPDMIFHLSSLQKSM